MHWYCGDLVWDCSWANFVYFWQNYLPATHPYFHFWMITSVNINGFSPNLVCALILWRSALRLLMVEFRPFLTELSAHNTSIFYFRDNNLNNSQWIFAKFDMCFDIVEICFGCARWLLSSIFDSIIYPSGEKIRLGISCAMQMIHMKCQLLISLKNTHKIKMLFAAVVISCD